MPFVPLRSRKRYEVILDDDKEQIAATQRFRDNSTLAQYYGASPSAAGYRFGNHPMTMGVVRGPEPPFKGATNPLRPPSADHDLPASMRRARSSPSLQNSAGNLMMACHPLTTELKRWEKLAEVTEKGQVDQDLKKSLMMNRNVEPPPKPPVRTGGLVNFPKYMLIHNCHLKQTDLKRFKEQQEEEMRLAMEAANAHADSPLHSVRESSLGGSTVRYQEPSWGAPLLRGKESPHNWAGSALPGGRGSRHSNPFRIG